MENYQIKPISENSYDKTVSCIRRNGDYIWNSRKQETFIGHKDMDYPSKLREHGTTLRRFASISYHNQINRSCGVKLEKGFIIAVSPKGEAQILPKVKLGTEVRGSPTAQFKTVWFSKGMRRQ